MSIYRSYLYSAGRRLMAYHMAWHDIILYGMAWYEMKRQYMTWRNITWHGGHDIPWRNMTWTISVSCCVMSSQVILSYGITLLQFVTRYIRRINTIIQPEYAIIKWTNPRHLLLTDAVTKSDDDELRLVNDLFHSDNYSKEVRPVKNKNAAIKVIFGIAYTQLVELVSNQPEPKEFWDFFLLHIPPIAIHQVIRKEFPIQFKLLPLNYCSSSGNAFTTGWKESSSC